jgi:hypothetical protein
MAVNETCQFRHPEEAREAAVSKDDGPAAHPSRRGEDAAPQDEELMEWT